MLILAYISVGIALCLVGLRFAKRTRSYVVPALLFVLLWPLIVVWSWGYKA